MAIFDWRQQSPRGVNGGADMESTLQELESGRPTWDLVQGTRVDSLATRLRETVSWCAKKMDGGTPADCLRDRSVAPQCLSNSRWRSVSDVAGLRRQFLGNDVSDKGWRSNGRLLVYYPDAEVTDGASEAASDGFFDLYDAPPWGTWIAYFEDPNTDPDSSYRSYLVAWVPQELTAAASAGVEVNCVSSVVWLDQTDVRARPILESVLKLAA